MKTVQRTEEIPYETEETKTSSMYVGRTKTVQEGVNGERQITELVTYVDNVAVEHEASERKSREKPGAQKGECGHEVQEQLQQQREFERIQFLHIANFIMAVVPYPQS